MSIDGDYDDEEMQNVTVVSFGLGVATAPPLDDDYIVTCDPLPPCVKGGVIGELRSPKRSFRQYVHWQQQVQIRQPCLVAYQALMLLSNDLAAPDTWS